MPVRLIDPKATTDIEVSGTKFTVRQLQNGPAVALTRAQEKFLNDGDEEARSRIVDIITSVINAIDHPEANADDLFAFVNRLCLEDFLMLAVGISNASTLNKDEAKN